MTTVKLDPNAVGALVRGIADRRRALGLTQQRVARAMGTTQSAVSDLETGVVTDPRMATFVHYAAAVGASVQVVFDDGR